MTKKRILIISPFFFPEPISTGKFNTDLAVALRDKGNTVTVLCSHPFYPDWKPIKSTTQIEGITIIRGGGAIKYSNKATLRRILLELWYAFFVLKHIFKLRKKNDIIIPVFPPSLAFYTILPYIKKRIVKIGMVHDLQEIYASNKKGSIQKIIRFFIHKIEKRVFRSCDRLIFLSNEMKDTAKRHYNLEESKLVVQYPFTTYKKDRITNDLENLMQKDLKHVVYSGALGEKQNSKKLYDFFNYTSKNIENVQFHFFSQGTNFNNLKSQNDNNKIKFHDLVPSKNVEELYKRSTVQIIPQLPGISKGSLPSKLPNLLNAGCSILAITDKGSEIERLFKKYNLNTVVTLWDNEELCSVLEKILKKEHKENLHHIKIAQKLFNIDAMIIKILSINS